MQRISTGKIVHWRIAKVYRQVSSKPFASNDETSDYVLRNRQLTNQNTDLYPLLDASSKYSQLRIPQLLTKFEGLRHNPEPDTAKYQVNGRINAIRRSGKGLLFIDLIQDGVKLQIVVNGKRLANFDVSQHSLLRRGDIICAYGQPWRTRSGELSILVTEPLKMLAPCLHPLPLGNTLGKTTRAHNRVVDLLVNEESRQVLVVRAVIIRAIRDFFNCKGFIEVQTPMLSTQAGGASARPFVTQSNALSKDGKTVDLSLRVAPELWLKRLVLAGMDRVYELGQCFRNEGIDATHNPEFTTCEFYQSYATLDDLTSVTENLLCFIVDQVAQMVSSQQQNMHQYKSIMDSVTKLKSAFSCFNKIDFISHLENKTGRLLPEKLDDPLELLSYYKDIGLTPPSTIQSASKLLDHLASTYLEPDCEVVPTYIMNHPQVMAPLAKSTTTIINGIPRKVSRRFELFINGKELVNAYEEENSPLVQNIKFTNQAQDRTQLQDLEAPLPDESYVEALEWGLPPTGGWGIGIDRLIMLMTSTSRIDQVMTFGGLKIVNYQ